MRDLINLVEKMVERDISRGGYNIAINPTKAEWQHYFPDGAAGVLMKDGTIVIGDGEALDHGTLVRQASLNGRNKKFHLQLFNGRAIIEFWDELMVNGEEWPHDHMPSAAEIEQYTRYPAAKRRAAADEVRTAVHRFFPEATIVVELKSGVMGGDNWLEETY